MRTVIFALAAATFCLAGCKSQPDTVTVTPNPAGDVTFTESYQIDEGQTIDLVIGAGSGAKVTSSALPTNATLMNGIFTFAPDYTQAGFYSVTFTITVGTTVTTKVVAVRVLNVVHITSPAPITVNEGSAATVVTFTSNTPMGTIVSYSADLTEAPGAVLDPVAGTLSFTPSWRWVDTRPPGLAIVVTASAQQPVTGKWQTSTAVVEYQINEATSFTQELVPMFKFSPSDPGGTNQPTLVDPEGHNCVKCHDGSGPNVPAAVDFHPASIYTNLVNAAVAPSSLLGQCSAETANGVQRVTPNDLTKSLWFWKISGTKYDGAGNNGALCGVQMPENVQPYWLTVTDEKAWSSCTDDNCRTSLDCVDTDITCKLNAQLVRKAKLWIMAGAPKN